jgi:hypothetical protein
MPVNNGDNLRGRVAPMIINHRHPAFRVPVPPGSVRIIIAPRPDCKPSLTGLIKHLFQPADPLLRHYGLFPTDSFHYSEGNTCGHRTGMERSAMLPDPSTRFSRGKGRAAQGFPFSPGMPFTTRE